MCHFACGFLAIVSLEVKMTSDVLEGPSQTTSGPRSRAQSRDAAMPQTHTAQRRMEHCGKPEVCEVSVITARIRSDPSHPQPTPPPAAMDSPRGLLELATVPGDGVRELGADLHGRKATLEPAHCC